MKNVIAVLCAAVMLATVGFAGSATGLSKKEVMQLTATAKTPEDHLKLSNYWRTQAEKLDKESAEHAKMAQNYRAQATASEIKRPGAANTASHCELLSEQLAKAAKAAKELAADHEEMAKKQ